MEREEFGDPKRARRSGQFHGASSGGRGSQRVSGSFQQRGPMPTFEGGQTSREGNSFRSIVSSAKEAELMEREEFAYPKRARISG